MSRTRVCSMLSVAVLAAAPAAYGAGVTIFQDDFESYADTTAMLGVYNNSAGTLANLDTTLESGNKSLNAPGGTANPNPVASHVINPTNITPSDAEPLVWQFDFYWDGSGGKRIAGGLRDNANGHALGAVIEMGYYNSAYNPITATNGAGFAVRTAVISGSGNLVESTSGLQGWRLLTGLDSNNDPVLLHTLATANTWMTFKAVFKSKEIDYSVDLNRDGTIDSTYVAVITDNTKPDMDVASIAFNDVRFGGPSNLWSSGGGANFDNLLIKTDPAAPPHFPGDTNNDGVVDLVDLNNVLNNFGATDLGNPGDDNTDGTVDLVDLNNVLNNFGATHAASALSTVPEPASLSLLALGATTLLARRRRD